MSDFEQKPNYGLKRKSPVAAVLLSLLLFAGLGQIYVGKYGKGIAFLIPDVALLFAGLGTGTIVLMLILQVWSAVDAYHEAKRFNEELGIYH